MWVYELMEDDPLANLKQIGAYIRQQQKREMVKHPYKPLLNKLSMFQKKSFPRLRGRAADLLCLHSVMLEIWQLQMTAGNTQHEQIKLMLIENTKVADILEEYHPRNGYLAVPEEPHKRLFQHGLNTAQLHCQLHEFYKGKKKCFNITSKTHFALHSLQLALYIHPSLVWCFKGETSMHYMQKVWKRCLPGAKHWMVGVKAAWKYRHLMHLRDAKL